MARVLLVDDDAAVRKLLKDVLGASGHQVYAAEGGVDALAMATSQAIDAAVVSVFSPDSTQLIAGLAAARPGLPVIAITGGCACCAGDLSDRALELGAMRVLAKPFRMATLGALVAAAVAGPGRLPDCAAHAETVAA